MGKRTMQELTIKDPFMFAAAMTDEDACKKLLEIVLERKILEVRVDTEKTMVYHADYHGIRLDVLTEEQGTKRRFNVEMQVKNEHNLAWRSRFYHAHLDMDMLGTSEDYKNLPDVYVIFICDFDPVGDHLYRYTFLSTCQENGRPMEDGTKTIWLSTAGQNEDEVPSELVSFLKYVKDPECPILEKADSTYVEELQRRIAEIKKDREWEARYMLLRELLDDERAEGKAEGKAEAVLQMLSFVGKVPESVAEQIQSEKNLEMLEGMLLATRTVSSVDEFVDRFLKK